jgi:hypothetical protein
MGSIFFASCDSQGYDGGILTRLHTEIKLLFKTFHVNCIVYCSYNVESMACCLVTGVVLPPVYWSLLSTGCICHALVRKMNPVNILALYVPKHNIIIIL